VKSTHITHYHCSQCQSSGQIDGWPGALGIAISDTLKGLMRFLRLHRAATSKWLYSTRCALANSTPTIPSGFLMPRGQIAPPLSPIPQVFINSRRRAHLLFCNCRCSSHLSCPGKSRQNTNYTGGKSYRCVHEQRKLFSFFLQGLFPF
jgi:hypothetical protein